MNHKLRVGLAVVPLAVAILVGTQVSSASAALLPINCGDIGNVKYCVGNYTGGQLQAGIQNRNAWNYSYDRVWRVELAYYSWADWSNNYYYNPVDPGWKGHETSIITVSDWVPNNRIGPNGAVWQTPIKASWLPGVYCVREYFPHSPGHPDDLWSDRYCVDTNNTVQWLW